MGNRLGFSRSIPYERLQIQGGLQSQSREALPFKKVDNGDCSRRKSEDSLPDYQSRLVTSGHSKLLCLAFIAMTLLATTFIIASAAISISLLFNNSFVSRAEVNQLMNESNALCSDRLDKVERCCNDSWTMFDDKIAALEKQLNGTLISQADTSKKIADIQTDKTKQFHVFQESFKSLRAKDDSISMELVGVQKNISKLQEQLHDTKVRVCNLSSDLVTKADSLHTMQTSLRSTVYRDLTNISSSQDELRSLVSSLELNISHLAIQLIAVRESMEQAKRQLSMVQSDTSLSGQLSELERRFDSLSTEVHHPVNLYKGCKEEKESCSIDPVNSRDYWRDCATVYLPLNKEVCCQCSMLEIL